VTVSAASAPRPSSLPGCGPYSVINADFNGDGNRDLAVANYNSGTLSVLLGNGAGGFGAKTDRQIPMARPSSVISADFNGDGTRDLAVAHNHSNRTSVMLGDGTGGFGVSTDFSTASGAYAVTSADFTGDGKPDLAIGNGATNVAVLLNTTDTSPASSFAAPASFGTGLAPVSVTNEDFNGDGRRDLVVANSASDSVSVLLGNGVGGVGARTDFVTGSALSQTQTSSEPSSVIAADLNGDGKRDLGVANRGSDSVSVLLGDGVGGVGARTDFVTGSEPSSVIAADFNGDGRRDLAVSNRGSDSVSVLLGNGGSPDVAVGR